VEELHIADVVDVDALLEDDDESSAVELDGEDRGRERQLADGRLTLRSHESVSTCCNEAQKRTRAANAPWC